MTLVVSFILVRLGTISRTGPICTRKQDGSLRELIARQEGREEGSWRSQVGALAQRAKRRADRAAAEVAAQEVMEWLEEGDGDSRLQEPLRHDRLPMEVLAQKMSEEYERGERLVRKLHVLDHLIQAH